MDLETRREFPSEIIANVRYGLIQLESPALPSFLTAIETSGTLREGVEVAREFSREHLGVDRVPIWPEEAPEKAP